MTNPDCFIIHYAEVALKGKNRPFFENTLTDNIKQSLRREKIKSIERDRGKIVIWTDPFSEIEKIKEKLNNVVGIAYFSAAFCFDLKKGNSGVNDVIDSAADKISDYYKGRQIESFRVVTKRSDKSFKLNSMQVSALLGAALSKKLPAKVDLKNPEVSFFVEIDNYFVFIYFQKHYGYGGLPVGSSGRVVSLLSSGLDSAVASFLMVKRGCSPVYVHFHSYPQTTLQSKENVEKLVKKISKHQLQSVLYFVSLLKIQKEIIMLAPQDYAVLLYRRSMIRIACEIAKKEKALALVTGESVGQVASQTIENIYVTDAASSLPILRPLAGSNKEEIIEIAKKIGTYDISSLPYEDCCTLFVPKHPKTKADIGSVEIIEKKILHLKQMETEATEGAEIKKIIFGED